MLFFTTSLLNRIFRRNRTGWIGLDIGSQSVKLAQLEVVNGEKEIVEAAIVPLPESAKLTVDSLRSGWLTDLVRNELTAHPGFRGKSVACALSMSVTEFRSMTIPPGTEAERREMIAQELSETGSIGSPGVEFDYWEGFASSQDPAASESAINVLSISEALAEEIAQSVHHAGLHCRVLDGGPFTLSRSVDLVQDDAEAGRTVAVLDWGHRAAHFVIVVNHQPVFSRVFKDCGVGDLTAAVQQSLGLSTEDCHELLSTSGVSNPYLERSAATELQELADDFMGQTFQRLSLELERTLSYLKMQRPELLPEMIWLTGGGATIRNVAERLSHESGLLVHPWRLDQRATIDP